MDCSIAKGIGIEPDPGLVGGALSLIQIVTNSVNPGVGVRASIYIQALLQLIPEIFIVVVSRKRQQLGQRKPRRSDVFSKVSVINQKVCMGSYATLSSLFLNIVQRTNVRLRQSTVREHWVNMSTSLSRHAQILSPIVVSSSLINTFYIQHMIGHSWLASSISQIHPFFELP